MQLGHQGWLCASPMFKVTQGAQGRGGNRTPATLMPGQHRCHCMGEIFPTICAAFLETGESLLAPLCLPGTDFFFSPALISHGVNTEQRGSASLLDCALVSQKTSAWFWKWAAFAFLCLRERARGCLLHVKLLLLLLLITCLG